MFRPAAEWQTEAWEFFDTVPELKFAANWAGNLVAKVKLYPAVLNDQGEALAVTHAESGIPEATAKLIDGLLGGLMGEFGGQADVQRELTVNLDVAGECTLVGWAASDSGPETWEIRSVSEVSSKDGRLVVKGSPDDKNGRPIGEMDTAVRCWSRHPRWSDLADTNVKALFTELRSLQVLSQQIMAESMSRANAGLLLLPNELSFGTEGNTDAPPDGADDEQDDPFVADLTEHVTRPVQDAGDPSSIAPLVVRGPAEYLGHIRHMLIARDTGDQLDKRIDARVQRVARGLNVPVEVVMGHAGTTFSNAQQISEDEFTDHLEPRVLLQCDLLTVGYLRPKMVGALAQYASRVFVWYDASALMDAPNLSEAADAAYDRGTISGATYRTAKGFTEEDKPEPAEALASLVTRKGILTAELSGVLLKYVDPSFVPPAVGPGAGPAPDPVQASALLAAAAQQAGMTRAMLSMLGIELPGAGHVIETQGRDPADPTLPRG